jgi:hypothetical protein
MASEFKAPDQGIEHSFNFRMERESGLSRIFFQIAEASGEQELGLQLGDRTGRDVEKADVIGCVERLCPSAML